MITKTNYQLHQLILLSKKQLSETIRIRELLTRAVRLLEKIATPPPSPVRTPTSFFLSVSGQVNEP